MRASISSSLWAGAVILLEQDTGEFAPQGFGEKGGGFFGGHGMENWVSHHWSLRDSRLRGDEPHGSSPRPEKGSEAKNKKIAEAIF